MNQPKGEPMTDSTDPAEMVADEICPMCGYWLDRDGCAVCRDNMEILRDGPDDD